MKFLNYFFTALTAAAAGAVTGCIVQSSINIKAAPPRQELPELNHEDQFIIKDHDGFLALYREESDTPYLILEYRTVFLNDYDRDLVTRGISVPTEKEMENLIEDLTG
ncbi:MAG: hypothetical protein PUB89_03345 [Oscillospiraceae bacterium]|nr:hypothetical protein [Oscillospiraceae bacterium]